MSLWISSPAPSLPTTKHGWEHLSAGTHVDWKLSWFIQLSSSQLQILEYHHQPYEIVGVLVGVTMAQSKQCPLRWRLMGWPGPGITATVQWDCANLVWVPRESQSRAATRLPAGLGTRDRCGTSGNLHLNSQRGGLLFWLGSEHTSKIIFLLYFLEKSSLRCIVFLKSGSKGSTSVQYRSPELGRCPKHG